MSLDLTDGDGEEERTARQAALIGHLERFADGKCHRCRARLCGHQVVMSVVMGFKTEPLCAPCLSGAVGAELGELHAHLRSFVDHRDCYRAAWAWSEEREGLGACRYSSPGGGQAAQTPQARSEAAPVEPAVAWDAGQLACGDLVLELRRRLSELAPARLLELTALDPGAREDIPAWCGLTGHTLVSAKHPVYLIRRKES